MRDYFNSLHEKVSMAGLAVALWFDLKNDSGVAAEGLRVELEIDANGSMLAEREDLKRILGSLELPEPPDRSPVWAGSPVPHFRTLTDVLEDQRRDPVKFYWADRAAPPSKRCSLHCEVFHAKRKWSDAIYIFPHELPVSLEVRLRVSAANLPDVVGDLARITISEADASWSDDFVQEILPEELRGKVSGLE